jgi:hypothetical protein
MEVKFKELIHNSTNLKVRMVNKKQHIFCDVNAKGPKIWGYGLSPYLPHSRASSRLSEYGGREKNPNCPTQHYI